MIQDNYIHGLQSNNSGPHYDGIQTDGGISNVVIRHNTIINDHGQTSAINLSNYFGSVRDVAIDNNRLVGGGYTIYSDGQFSSGGTISGVSITNNDLGKGQYGYTSINNNTPVFTGNYDDITGSLLPGQQAGNLSTVITTFSTDSGTLGDGLTNDNTLTLSGTAAANSTVKVFEGTTQVGQTTANGSGAWSVTTAALADGSHSFTATATSGGTTSAASSPLTVRVDTVAPNAPTIASFSTDTGTVGDGITSDNTLTLTGAAAANSAVKVYDGAMLLGSATANGSGAWSYTTGVLSNAPHSLTATATDAAGNTSAASSVLAVTVNTAGTGAPTTLTGTSGNDMLPGTIGADVMTGLAGNDTYTVNNSGDQVVELANQGTDVVVSTIHFSLPANVETLVLQGSADLQGYGNAQANTLYGNTGNNLLNGGAGADTMIGGAGNDTYFVDNAADAVIENANEGTDAVFATAHFGLSANVETLVLQGSADLQGYGNAQANTLYGNTGNNLLNGGAGADTMLGGAGNDTYFVDNVGDIVFENPNEGTDAVFSTVNYTLTANVETLVLQGTGNLSGTGNALNNTIHGNDGNNTLNGGAGSDVLVGHAGNDTFVFNVGQANGDTVFDFDGQGAAAGDSLRFVGYGPGATFTQNDATHWQINYNGGTAHEIITFSNAASIHASDFVFV